MGVFYVLKIMAQKKIYEKYCVSNCPLEASYNDGNNCVNTCGSKYVILFKNECITSCPAGYNTNTTYKICYPNCKFGENLI